MAFKIIGADDVTGALPPKVQTNLGSIYATKQELNDAVISGGGYDDTSITNRVTTLETAVNTNIPATYATKSELSAVEGTPGASAYEIAVANGYTGTETQWIASLEGPAGLDGTDGASAYQIALNNGFVGTEQDFIDSLKGADGQPGTNGTDGVDGASAYEIAQANGFAGTEAQFADSLINSMVWRGDWDINTTYEVGDVVSVDGLPYVAIAETTGELPANNSGYTDTFDTDLSAWDITGLWSVNAGTATITATGAQWATSFLIKNLDQDGTATFTGLKEEGSSMSTDIQFSFAGDPATTYSTYSYSPETGRVNRWDGSVSSTLVEMPVGFVPFYTEPVDVTITRAGADITVVQTDSNGTHTVSVTDATPLTGTGWGVAHFGGNNGEDNTTLNGFSFNSGTPSSWDAVVIISSGLDGEPGTSVTSITDDDADGVATILYSDGSTAPLTLPEGPQGLPGDNGLSAYQIAVNGGYAGTEADWLASLKGPKGDTGEQGLSAYEVAVANGFVGTEQDFITSLEGPAGADGQGITITGSVATRADLDNPAIVDTATLTVGDSYLTNDTGLLYIWDGTQWGTGVQFKGDKGDTGSTGASAYQIAVTNGFVGTQAEWLASLKGADGSDGADGLSAYQIWLNNGNAGTETDFLADLQGPAGTDGDSAYEVALDNGFVGTEAEWVESVNKPTLVEYPGLTGFFDTIYGAETDSGITGASAYEIAVRNGYVGTESDWLASLEGTSGTDGSDGTDGRSAYQVAVDNGFVGTETDWLNSLSGADDPTIVRYDTFHKEVERHQSITVLPVSYIYPDYYVTGTPSQWNTIGDAVPTVQWAMINPSNGPGTSANTDYQTQLKRIVADGVKVMGYISTSYATRPQAEVQAEVAQYLTWYPEISGIFLDEAVNGWSDQAGLETYYQDLRDWFDANHPELILINNPGSATTPAMVPTADMMLTFENTAATYLATADTDIDQAHYLTVSKSKFWHAVYDIPDEATALQVIEKAKRLHVGHVYLTNRTAAENPWSALPADWLWNLQLKEFGTNSPSIESHSELTDLGADDHTQYALADGTRGNFAAPTHTHTTAQVTGLDTALAGKSDTSHTHTYASITGKPTTFTPSAHTHVTADITGLDTALAGKASTTHTHAWTDITSKPTTFTPSAHTHPQSNITNLTTDLSNKAPLAAALPVGGTTGQVLSKTSATNYATQWIDPPTGGSTVAAKNTIFVVSYTGTAWEYTTLAAAQAAGLTTQKAWFMGNPGGTLPGWERPGDIWTQE